jgi:branched-chain amino acid transport system substrate-binding protein
VSKVGRGWTCLAALVAVFVVVAVACEDEEEEQASPTGTATAAVTGTATPAASPTEVGEVPGVTETEIKLGSHKPLSGPAAAFGVIAKGEQAYFDYVNEELGGVCGRDIVLKTEDDMYTPSRTVEAVRRLIEDEEVFAIFGGLGDSTCAAVYKDLNERGIPYMYIASGCNLWVEDPQTYRYVFGGIPSFLTEEGPVMGEFIAENFPGAKVGVFGQNDLFGQEIEAGVREGLAGRNEIVDVQMYSVTNPDIRSQIINLRESGAEVVAMGAIPEFAAFFIQLVRGQGWDVPVVSSGVIADPIIFDLAGADNVFNVWLPAYLIPPWETDVPGVEEYLRIMETYASDLDPQRSYIYYGYAAAQLMTETLSRTCDNLTREGLIQAAESIRGWEQPVAWGPISMSPTDHAPWQTFKWGKAENGGFVVFGDLVVKESTG